MKIRSDFVTNSSSSSFCVEICIKAKNGEEFTARIDPDDGGGNGCADVNCSGEKLLHSSNVQELLDLLQDSVEVQEPAEAEDYFKDYLKGYCENIASRITDISQIDAVTLTRIWSAWGEGASCFGANLECFAPELPELASKVCESAGEEKEEAKAELAAYLSDYDGSITSEWGGEFPGKFMGANPKASIVWKEMADTIEDFSEKVIEESLPDNDYAEEKTIINFTDGSVQHTSEYILKNNDEYEDDEW